MSSSPPIRDGRFIDLLNLQRCPSSDYVRIWTFVVMIMLERGDEETGGRGKEGGEKDSALSSCNKRVVKEI